MLNFPIVCVDGFFKYPELIVEWSEELEYNKSTGYWPGVRTSPLKNINQDFNDSFIKKLLSSVYNLNFEYILWESSSLHFHKHIPFNDDKNDIRNRSWIHRDDADDVYNNTSLAAIVYLNKNIDSNSGISFFEHIGVATQEQWDKETDMKHKLYTGNKVNIEEYKKIKIEHESRFIETASFKNFYNRMIMFPGNLYHRIDNFCTGTDEQRLSLNFWMGPITETNAYPLERIYNCNL